MELKQILDTIASTNEDGLLKPEDVVEAARPVDAPLHTHFEWNDSKAAEQYRLHQARNLIRSVYIEVGPESAPQPIRAYVSMPADRVNGGGYRDMQAVLDSQLMRRQLAEEINGKIRYWQQKAKLFGAAIDFSSVLQSTEKMLPAKPKAGNAGTAA